MRITFCGAARTVTGSCHFLELDDGLKILLDCGLYQGNESEFEDFNDKWLFDPAEIDCLILSHAHIDHSGRIPKLVKDGFNGRIVCTSATSDLCTVMLLDSAKIQEKDSLFINRRNIKKGSDKRVQPYYTSQDVYNSLGLFTGIGYDRKFEVSDNVSMVFSDAGHIFGSSSITLTIKEDSCKTVRLGFTGDIGRPSRPILRDPKKPVDLDYLICESTYGGRHHSDLPNDEQELLAIIERVCVKQKGKVLIPAFSVGRTQEIVYLLDRLETSGRLPDIPVFVDSPLAVNATDIFRLHPECFDAEILNYMIEDPNPFGFNRLKYVRSTEESKKINEISGPAVIISAAGMMTGGRILHHLLNHAEEEKNALLIVGYCAPDTLGAMIRAGVRDVRIFDIPLRIRAEVIIMDSFSAHGDQDEMLDYLSLLDREKLRNIFLVHGEYENQELFASALYESGFKKITIPEFGDKFEIK